MGKYPYIPNFWSLLHLHDLEGPLWCTDLVLNWGLMVDFWEDLKIGYLMLFIRTLPGMYIFFDKIIPDQKIWPYLTVLHRKGKFVFILDDDMTEVGSIFRSSEVQLVSSTCMSGARLSWGGCQGQVISLGRYIVRQPCCLWEGPRDRFRPENDTGFPWTGEILPLICQAEINPTAAGLNMWRHNAVNLC